MTRFRRGTNRGFWRRMGADSLFQTAREYGRPAPPSPEGIEKSKSPPIEPVYLEEYGNICHSRQLQKRFYQVLSVLLLTIDLRPEDSTALLAEKINAQARGQRQNDHDFVTCRAVGERFYFTFQSKQKGQSQMGFYYLTREAVFSLKQKASMRARK